MDKVGSRVVAMTTDTSSDAPDAFYEPKRSLYEGMVAKEKAEEAASSKDPDHDPDHE
jgi:hypothetical protein